MICGEGPGRFTLCRTRRTPTGTDPAGVRREVRDPAEAGSCATGRSPRDQAWRAAWMSSVMVTFSPTSTPPVSSAAFQFTPKSLRSISVLASKPAL
jgi:hypothetical protein